jgi:hypothetical protein
MTEPWWPAGSANADDDEALLILGITEVEHAKRVRAAEDLQALGIHGSPSDIEYWITMSEKQKEKITRKWLVYKASYKRM